MNPAPKRPVFGLGLSKTGTHSLNKALTILGIPSIHYPDPADMLAGRFDKALEGYKAATDITVAAFYRELDAAYPGSRFVLTLRDMPEWLESVGDHRKRRDGRPEEPGDPKAEVRRRLYGAATFEERTYAAAYERHAAEVRAYFAERPGTLLEMNICAGDGWEALCPFLGLKVPPEPFPDLNKRPVGVIEASGRAGVNPVLPPS
jgi:hypothetical protein